MSLRPSQIGPNRRGSKKLRDKRLKDKVCVQCGQPVNHHKRQCDYCYLREKIRILRKELTRVERLFLKQKV